MQYRDLTAPPLVVSGLLKSPEAQKMKDAGMLVGDREVIEIMLRKLLDPVYKSGAVVDGFPRTKVGECVKLLYQKLIEQRNKFKETLYSEHFKKPHFHIVVLFIDKKESVKRQINRGVEAQAHNEEVLESGVGEIEELRPTDLTLRRRSTATALLKRRPMVPSKTCVRSSSITLLMHTERSKPSANVLTMSYVTKALSNSTRLLMIASQVFP